MSNTPHNIIPTKANLNGEQQMLCPVCGWDYVHPIGIDCWSPGSAKGHVKIDDNGIHISADGAGSGRGVRFAFSFTCEAGHLFSYDMQFHKGNTTVKRLVNQISTSDTDNGPRTIWRD